MVKPCASTSSSPFYQPLTDNTFGNWLDRVRKVTHQPLTPFFLQKTLRPSQQNTLQKCSKWLPEQKKAPRDLLSKISLLFSLLWNSYARWTTAAGWTGWDQFLVIASSKQSWLSHGNDPFCTKRHKISLAGGALCERRSWKFHLITLFEILRHFRRGRIHHWPPLPIFRAT